MYSAGQYGKKELLNRSQTGTSEANSGSSVKSQVLDLKTLPIFSPLKISVKILEFILVNHLVILSRRNRCNVRCLFKIKSIKLKISLRHTAHGDNYRRFYARFSNLRVIVLRRAGEVKLSIRDLHMVTIIVVSTPDFRN